MSKQSVLQFKSPMPTPSKPEGIKRESEEVNDTPSKKQKCLTPDITVIEDEDEDGVDSIDVNNVLTEDQVREAAEKEIRKEIERKIKMEIRIKEKQEKELLKERERQQKQEKRERERLEKEAKKELEKQLKIQRELERQQKKEEERKEKERLKEEERKERERLKEEERKEKERLKEEERKEKERLKEEERKERERVKEEERKERERVKEEERKERERVKEEERKERERIKEEERKEKEKGQRKIASFFSINQRKSPKKETSLSNTQSSVFDEIFLPFNVKKNTIMCKSTQLPPNELDQRKTYIDELLQADYETDESRDFFKANKSTVNDTKSVSPDDIIEALNSSDKTETEIYQMLKHIPTIKYIEFYENSKPPYIGTWCSVEHRKLQFPILEPFNTAVTGYDYNYDSDLDWNGEDEEGEDIDDEDDEEEDEDDDDDMEDFVESNDTKKTKKFLGPLEPICIWNDGSYEIFNEMKYERLNVNINFSIDPTINYYKENQETNDKEPPTKQIIQDQAIISQLVKFIEKYNDFSISTLVDLSKKEFGDFTKAILKLTIQDIATYNKKSGNWEVKPDLKTSIV